MALVRLQKGQMLDAKVGFVDSWNNLADSVEGMYGTGGTEVKHLGANRIVVDSSELEKRIDDIETREDNEEDDELPPVPDLPPPLDTDLFVLKAASGCFAIASDDGTNVTIKNAHVMVGSFLYTAPDNILEVTKQASSVLAVRIDISGASPSFSFSWFGSVSLLASQQRSDRNAFIFPLYVFDDKKDVVEDIRNIAVLPAVEFGE